MADLVSILGRNGSSSSVTCDTDYDFPEFASLASVECRYATKEGISAIAIFSEIIY